MKPKLTFRYVALLFGMFACLLGVFIFKNHLIIQAILLSISVVCGAKSGKILSGEE